MLEISKFENLTAYLEVLEKVEKFEKKAEFNRFLLILSVAGFVAIIGGWISYIFNRFLGVDPTFFIFNLTDNPDLSPSEEPILFLSVWIVYLIPLVSVVILSTGSTGIMNWNKSYRFISVFVIFLFFFAHVLILLAGLKNARMIPFIWGLTVGIGFLISSLILKRETSDKIVTTGLVVIGSLSIILGLTLSFFAPEEIGQLLYGLILGIGLSVCGIFGYYRYGRVS
ncbi:MAG: hypothetical protein ACXAB2_12310 [Candidatus Hodarchaeales archaeon]|jgi:hypothetical protein